MVELPALMRAVLAERLDEYFNEQDDLSDVDVLAEGCVEIMEQVAEETSAVEEDLVARLEGTIDPPKSLVEVLSDAFGSDFGFTGEEVLYVLDQKCELEWMDGDEDAEAAGLFGSADAYDFEDDV